MARPVTLPESREWAALKKWLRSREHFGRLFSTDAVLAKMAAIRRQARGRKKR